MKHISKTNNINKKIIAKLDKIRLLGSIFLLFVYITAMNFIASHIESSLLSSSFAIIFTAFYIVVLLLFYHYLDRLFNRNSK